MKKSGNKILWENRRAIYIVHLPYRFHAAENAVCKSRSTVCQFNHFTTLLRTSEFTQVSSFSSTVAKDRFSWCTFLNVWKRLLFARDGFAGVRSKDSAMLSIVPKTFSQMARPDSDLLSLQLRGNLGKTSSASCLLRMCRALPRVNLHYFCLLCMHNTSKSDSGKFRHKRFCYSQEKSKRQGLLLFFKNDRIQNFWEALHISRMHYWFS